jgi:hypothetical protein
MIRRRIWRRTGRRIGRTMKRRIRRLMYTFLCHRFTHRSISCVISGFNTEFTSAMLPTPSLTHTHTEGAGNSFEARIASDLRRKGLRLKR